MKNSKTSRRDFLKTSALAGVAGLAAGGASAADAPGEQVILSSGIVIKGDVSVTRPRPAGQKPVHNLTTKPLEKVRVAVIGMHRGMAHVDSCSHIDFCEVVAVCDIYDDRCQDAVNHVEKATGKKPVVYSGNEHIWEKMLQRDDIDAVFIATPWDWHVPMALGAMQNGKHAFVEVAAAVTIDDCWRLVDTSERLQRHCVILENCCYGEQEMFVLNLARGGVFGELTHGECAYLHDLREVLFSLGTEGDWRRNYHWLYNGNLYPTHGLGPVAQYLGLGRGDQFKFLCSISSPERSLTKHRNEAKPNGGKHAGEHYICGDMNTTIIKTVMGRTVMLQHDVVSPRPYSRINALYGTGATFFDYPPRLSVNNPKDYGLKAENSEAWLSEDDLKIMRDKFTHPLWKKFGDNARGYGHGGMDYIMSWAHMNRLRQGKTPDSVVYDAAAWSSIIELSSKSVATGSMPVEIPDFTRGLWREIKPIGIDSGEAA